MTRRLRRQVLDRRRGRRREGRLCGGCRLDSFRFGIGGIVRDSNGILPREGRENFAVLSGGGGGGVDFGLGLWFVVVVAAAVTEARC